MKRERKAFTLSELLIVVVVIAALSAVALPQYKKVLESRKIGEAESVLTSVRNEQERRCAVGKAYAKNLDTLSDLVPDTATKNFDYKISGDSMLAQSKGSFNYTLKVAAFRDGRICCENGGGSSDCSKFNYPSCKSLEDAGGIVSAKDECGAEEEMPDDIGTTEDHDWSKCTPSEDVVWGSCATNKQGYTDGGNKAKQTVTTDENCNQTKSDWDYSECFTTRSGPCDCSTFGGIYDQGDDGATCNYTEFANGNKDPSSYAVVSTEGCYQKGNIEPCDCNPYGGAYDQGGSVARCTYELYTVAPFKRNYKAANIKSCFKYGEETCAFESTPDRDCQFTPHETGSEGSWNINCTLPLHGVNQPWVTCDSGGVFWTQMQISAMCPEFGDLLHISALGSADSSRTTCEDLYEAAIDPWKSSVNSGDKCTPTVSSYTRYGFNSYENRCTTFECKCNTPKIYPQ